MNSRTSRPALRALAAVGTGAAALTVAVAGASGHARPVAITVPVSMTGQEITAQSETLKPGTALKASAIFTPRVFATASHGAALASDSQGTDYAVATTNGGATWRIVSPALFTATADGPNAVGAIGIDGPRTDYVYGPENIAVTTNAGATWYRVYPEGYITAVVPVTHGLAAYMQVINAKGTVSSTVQYVSTDGGRHWKLSTALGG